MEAIKVKNELDYNQAMKEIEALMNKGSEQVTEEELNRISELGIAAQQYEKHIYAADMPSKLMSSIYVKMFELRLKHKDLAERLNISKAKLSLILAGKQRPDIGFLQGIHKELGIDGNFILQNA